MVDEVSNWSDEIMTWLATEGLQFGRNLLVFLVILAIGSLVSRVLQRTVRLGIERSHLDPSPILSRFIVNVVGKGAMAIAIIIGLGNLGIDTGALIAGLGVSGLVLGFALQDTLSNFASGMMILLYRPFDVGHFVEIDGLEGSVKDLTLVSTVLTTIDNKEVTIPNSKVWGNSVTNFTATGSRRLIMEVGASYDEDIDEVKEVLLDVLSSNERTMTDPGPAVVVSSLGDHGVNFNLLGWVKTADYIPVQGELLRAVKYRFDKEGIEIPFAQQVVWLNPKRENAGQGGQMKKEPLLS